MHASLPRGPRPPQQIGQFPPVIQTSAPPPIQQTVTAPPKPAQPVATPNIQPPIVTKETAGPPRFTFNQKTEEKSKGPEVQDQIKPFTFSGGPTSTPSRPAGTKFVFKSPEVADKENAKLTEEEKNEQDPDGDAGPHFEPIIPLPDLVEVKTGEEDEETLFNHRGKLYRWNDKQCKDETTSNIRYIISYII